MSSQSTVTSASVDWRQYAEDYDKLSKLVPYTQMMHEVVTSVPDGSQYILDASCGTGNFEAGYLNANPAFSGRIVGVDFSDAMLEIAERKVGSASQVTLLKQDLDQELCFSDGSFDCVTCVNTLYALPRPAHTLSEFYRVLKPGGVLIIATPKFGFEVDLVLKDHYDEWKGDPLLSSLQNKDERETEHVVEMSSLRKALLRMVYQNDGHSSAKKSPLFPSEEQLRYLLAVNGFGVVDFALVYANQSLFFVARKGIA